MKVNELRNFSKNDLKNELVSSLKELFNLRCMRVSEQPPKSHLFKKVKLKIARIKTLLIEKVS